MSGCGDSLPFSSSADNGRNGPYSGHPDFALGAGPNRLQKSGLSAFGTAASFSEQYLLGFSAQMLSSHRVTWGRYVIFFVHGAATTETSSIALPGALRRAGGGRA